MRKPKNKSVKEIKSIVKRYVDKEITADDVIELLPLDNDVDRFLDILVEDYYEEMMMEDEDESR